MTRKKLNLWERKAGDSPAIERKVFQPKRMELPTFQKTKNVDVEPVEEQEEQKTENVSTEPTFEETERILEELRQPKRNRPKRSKRRGYCISVCVSEEEEAILRASAAKAEMGFSEWARTAMFRFAKVKIPKR